MYIFSSETYFADLLHWGIILKNFIIFSSSFTNTYLYTMYIFPATPFGSLPILEVDGLRISQSLTIARYLARTYGRSCTFFFFPKIGTAIY